MVVYRDARPEDADALAALMRETFIETFGPLYPPSDLASFLAASYSPAQQYAEIIDGARGTRLAVEDAAPASGLVGYVQMGPMGLPVALQPGERAAEVKRLYVRRGHHGSGVADALMTWALAWATERGASSVYLGVYSENVRAQRFYARYGFERCGAYAFPVGATIDQEWILRRPSPLPGI
jgi:diamine N-acetyltransferase